MKPTPWLVPGVTVGLAVPAASIGVAFARNTLGANPVAEALNELGLLALVMLVLCLACTPLKIVFGFTWPIRIRKTLGLGAFVYAALHFLTYAVIDQSLNLGTIVKDVRDRTFILVGALALLILIPLAITSTAKMTKRLGFARWKALHRLAYVAALLGVVHFFLRVKKSHAEPVVYGAILVVLLAARIIDAARASKTSPRARPNRGASG